MQVLTLAASSLIAGMTSLIFILWWNKRIKDKAGTQKAVNRLQSEIGELITEINSTTERSIALLENKISSLNALIDRAGRIQKVLTIEKERNESADRIYTELGRSKSLPIVPPDQSQGSRTNFDSLSDRNKVLFLRRQGDTIDSITKSLAMSRGEVELIIALYDGNS